MKNKTQKPSGGKARGSIRVPVALMLALCMGASVYLGVLGVQGYLEHKSGTDYYGDLASSLKVTAQPAATAAPTPAPTAAPQAAEPEKSKGPLVIFTPQPRAQASAEPNETEMPEDEGPRSEMNFAAIWETCPDVVGWVTIEGTVIDYPIVQGEDNDFYLYHLPDKKRNSAGSIMMDVANSGDFTDDVNILHGHHMKSGAMFGDLDLYKKEAYYKEHPMMRLYTPQGDYDVAVFAAYSVDGSKFAYDTNFMDEEAFKAFYQYATTRSPYRTDVEVDYGDRMLMLSTCAYAYEYERFLVVGKVLEPENE